MQKYRLTLITENQKSIDKSKKFAELICKILNCQNGYKVSKYEKLDNSFRIEIIEKLENEINSIEQSVELTDRICTPWTVTYQRNENLVELMFNKSDFSSFRRNEFNVLSWAQFEIENE